MSVNILSRAGASLGVNWWRLASIVGAIAVFVVIAMAVLQTVYPSLPSSLRFLAYVVLFNLLPGLAVAGFLFTRVRPPGTFLIYALSFGTTANVLVFLPLWMAGVSSWFRAFPVVALCVLVLLWRRLRLPELFTDWVPVRGFAGWLAGAILLCGTPLLTMAYVLADDPVSVHSLHFAFQGVVVRSLETGWPPPNLTVAELTLSYHYAAHLWILAAFQNSGVDLGVLVARYGPLYFPACACAMLFAFSRFVLKLSAPAAALPIVAVFWVVGLPVIYAQIFGSFVPFGSALIMSPAFGFAVFLLALTCIVELRGRGRLGPVVVGMLTFIGTGARGVVGPIVICALALLATVVWRQTGTVRRKTVLHLLSAIAGCLAALVLFFTVGWDFSGTGFIQFTGQPLTFLAERQDLLRLPSLLIASGFPQALAAAIGFLVMAAFQAGFLTAGFYYQVGRMIRSAPSDTDILLIGASVAGVTGTFLTEAPGHSHLSFLQYATISMSLLGVQGLDRTLRRAPTAAANVPSQPTRIVVIAVTVGLLIVQLSEFPPQMWSWLRQHGGAAANSLLMSPLTHESNLAGNLSCDTDRSADALVAQVPANSVIVVVPGKTTLSRQCEYLWPLVAAPRPSVNPFTMKYIPARVSGPRGALFEQRRNHLTAAADGALQDRVAGSDLIAIAQTLPRDRPVFVLLAKSVNIDADPHIVRVAEQGRLALLKVLAQARSQ